MSSETQSQSFAAWQQIVGSFLSPADYFAIEWHSGWYWERWLTKQWSHSNRPKPHRLTINTDNPTDIVLTLEFFIRPEGYESVRRQLDALEPIAGVLAARGARELAHPYENRSLISWELTVPQDAISDVLQAICTAGK